MGSIWIARDEADLGRFAAVSEQSREQESTGQILTVKFVEGDDRRGVCQFQCCRFIQDRPKSGYKKLSTTFRPVRDENASSCRSLLLVVDECAGNLLALGVRSMRGERAGFAVGRDGNRSG